ncbi:MAG: hypothetical protein Kapaf2KO_11130 [Candidatus Kapaibacteriales bacterium]
MALLFLGFFSNQSLKADIVETDYGTYTIPYKLIKGEKYADLITLGYMTFGKGNLISENGIQKYGFTESGGGSITFLPNSLYFTFTEKGVKSIYQMKKPAIEHPENPSTVLIPIESYCSALSSDKFDFMIQGTNLIFKRLDYYKKELASKKNVAPTSSNTKTYTSQPKAKKQYSEQMLADYIYVKLQPLPKNGTEANMLAPSTYKIEFPNTKSPKKRLAIPVFEFGERVEISEAEEKKAPVAKKSRNNPNSPKLPSANYPPPTIKPDPEFSVPENMVREEVEEKLEKKKD